MPAPTRSDLRPLPVHLDLTSIYGASLAIEPSQIRQGALPFSRLLSLSQFVEALVIHDTLQYELGSTPDWIPYRDALDRSTLIKLCTELRVPLHPFDEQIDADDGAVLDAARWAAAHATIAPVSPLEWAVRFRSGCYDGVENVADEQNPMLERYLSVIADSGDAALNDSVAAAQSHLRDNHVGSLGLHVLIRTRLLEQYLVDHRRANYLPHFSRQPLIVVTNDTAYATKRWTIELLRRRRSELLLGNEPDTGPDQLSLALSPVLLACIQHSKTPEGIIEGALRLRDTPEAAAYRDECRRVTESSVLNTEIIQSFKLAVRRKLEGLHAVLPGDNEKIEHVSQIGLDGRFLHFFLFQSLRRKTTPAGARLGDAAATFLNDLLLHAMGVIRAQDRIADIYGVNVHYDSDVISWHRKS